MRKIFCYILFVFAYFFEVHDLKAQATNKIDTIGNVGIGTTSPETKIDVQGTNIIINAQDTEGYGYAMTRFRAGGGGVSEAYFGVDASSSALITGGGRIGYAAVISRQGNYPIQFATNNLARMTINGSGKIGLGISTPSYFMDIYEEQGSGTVANWNSSNDAFGFRFNNSAAYIGTKNFAVNNGANPKDFGISAGSGGNLLLGVGAGVEVIRLTNNYNVGIGTSSPSEKLSVNGNISSKKSIVTQTGWSDYVFNDDYKLKPLSEVSKFIKDNKHLPEVPSAKEIGERGLDLGANQAVLLKKIEELTLYVIDLKRENEAQQRRIERLENQIKIK